MCDPDRPIGDLKPASGRRQYAVHLRCTSIVRVAAMVETAGTENRQAGLGATSKPYDRSASDSCR